MSEFDENDDNPYRPTYTPASIRQYRGNPLIEAIDVPRKPEEIAIELKEDIEYSEEDRFAPEEDRLDMLQFIKEWREPRNYTVDMMQRVTRMIRYGLSPRNPAKPRYWADVMEQRESLPSDKESGRKKKKPKRKKGTATCMSIIGDSGSGKSSAIDSVLELFEQRFDHVEYLQKEFVFQQVTYIKVDCPANSSIKSLCQGILDAFDEVLGLKGEGSWNDLFIESQDLNRDDLVVAIHAVASAHGLGLLVIDEFQNVSDATSKDSAFMINFVVRLVNKLNIPIILVGTPRAIKVLRKGLRAARRFSGEPDMIFKRMEPGAEFDDFVTDMWKYQYVRKVAPLTPEILDAIYYASQGIIDLIVKVFIFAQVRAITTGRERLDPAIIRSTSDDWTLLRPFLEALRKGKIPNEDYADLMDFIDVDEEVTDAKKQLRNRNIHI